MRFTTLQLGIKSLMLHKLRSLLTMLGVILGVGSVISMLAIGEGSKREALERIRQLGAANVIIRSVKPTQKNSEDEGAKEQTSSRVLEYGLRYEDLDFLMETLPTVKRAVPITLVRKRAQAVHRALPNARILGTTPDYFEIKNLRLRRGRMLTLPDMERGRNVAVLSAGAAQHLFNFEDPLGKTVRLGTMVFRVVGVLHPQGSGNAVPGAMGSQDFNKDVYIPLSAARSRFGELKMIVSAGSFNFERNQLSEITLTVFNQNLVSQTAAMARKILKENHPRSNDIEVQVPLELLQQAEEEKRIWNLVLGSIAGISLLVGGIGIMNIMLATVTERTREIGIRRALGARQWDITIQFLIESVLLSAAGGILGIIFGVSVPLCVTYFSEIESHIQWWSMPMTFIISVGVGVLFGVYPARRAALMDPITALRHE
ncbi:MAG: ABC transporter ATP-binding protein [Blastopirellula sp.]|nr:ABC transporter ATP-binding protein [Blastopirellula sp.]